MPRCLAAVLPFRAISPSIRRALKRKSISAEWRGSGPVDVLARAAITGKPGQEMPFKLARGISSRPAMALGPDVRVDSGLGKFTTPRACLDAAIVRNLPSVQQRL